MTQADKKHKLGRIVEILALAVLAGYPLRHIFQGIDLQDTGYNYANFVYAGLEHMDPMWLYSTYLANVVGHFLTTLPFAGNLAGMNFYTGLFVSLLAVVGYLFCTRGLKMSKVSAFVGEIAAISLCWCPTAKLYDYLGYLFFLLCVILLYEGLTRDKMWFLFLAGVCLAANILVRFSNLPQAALILAVWGYAVLGRREQKKLVLRYTVWCLGGYLAAIVLEFGWIHLRYGLDQYVAGILRLFAMTDTATDYKATSMLGAMVHIYGQNSYWMIRLFLIAAAGTVIWCAFRAVTEKHPFFAKRQGLVRVLYGVLCFGWIGVSLWSIRWLYSRHFFSTLYYSYDSMLLPGVLFLMLTMLVAVVRILHPKAPKEEKLISGLLLLVILLTSIGSNNGVFPSLNNLFVAAPYTFWQCQRFVFGVKDWYTPKWRLVCSATPAKGILIAFLGLFLVQSVAFGAVFVFTESTGARNMTAQVTNNKVLEGVRMSPDKAEWLEEATDCIQQNGLEGREVILYGNLPALSYYLQLPSVFNPWSDLASYHLSTMEEEMSLLRDSMERGDYGSDRPLVIASHIYANREEGGREALQEIETDENYIQQIMEDPKWTLISEFMRDYGYEKIYQNERFTIWR